MNQSPVPQVLFAQIRRGKGQQTTEPKENIWSSLLDSVSAGKRLPEKNLILLGGGSETQKEFLETLGAESSKRPTGRFRNRPFVANEFALGYTYQDVLDADQEDTLARLSIYTLPEPLPSFGPLLRPLFTPRTIPETLLLILLDWAEPWNWLRQLRDWVCLLKGVLASLDDDSKHAMEKVMQEWSRRQFGSISHESSENRDGESTVSIPLGPGEFDEGLGLPLCVVCHNAEKIDSLETEIGWREEDFDYVLQFLRTVLLKHGASLVYTSSSNPNSLPILVQSMLGIHSLLKRQPLKHNVIDRDRILIPANWDSWGKIRILREGFDCETICNDWNAEIGTNAQMQLPKQEYRSKELSAQSAFARETRAKEQSSLLLVYSEVIQDPASHFGLSAQAPLSPALEVDIMPNQDFLAAQLAIMEGFKAGEEQAQGMNSNEKPTEDLPRNTNATFNDSTATTGGGRVNEHIGAVQFNMGGIQVDADDILKRLKEREREETPDRDFSLPPASTELASGEKVDSVALTNFFQGLIKKGGGANSPRAKAQQ